MNTWCSDNKSMPFWKCIYFARFWVTMEFKHNKAKAMSTAQNRHIYKSTTNKSMLLLSLHQLFRPNVYLLQVGIILIMLQVPHIAKGKWAEFFLNFQIFTPTVGLQWLLETEMWNTKDISKQFLKKIWIIFTSQEDKAYRRACQNKIIKLL